jgi:hypothetical protein
MQWQFQGFLAVVAAFASAGPAAAQTIGLEQPAAETLALSLAQADSLDDPAAPKPVTMTAARPGAQLVKRTRGRPQESAGPGSGEVPGLDDTRIQMVVAQQDLIRTLEMLSEQTRLKITVSKGLKGTTSRLRIDGTGRAALNAVADQAGAIWWWNGSEIRLAARNDMASQTVKGRDIAQAAAAGRDLGLPMDLITISRATGSQNVKITGPAGLVADFAALNEDVYSQMSSINLTKFGKRRTLKLD